MQHLYKLIIKSKQSQMSDKTLHRTKSHKIQVNNSKNAYHKDVNLYSTSKRSKTTIFILIHLASLDTEKRLLALLTLYLYTLLIFLHIKMALLVSVKDNFTSATCSYPTFQPLTPITTLRVKKHANLHSCIQWRTLTNFQNSFTVGFSKKFAIK